MSNSKIGNSSGLEKAQLSLDLLARADSARREIRKKKSRIDRILAPLRKKCREELGHEFKHASTDHSSRWEEDWSTHGRTVRLRVSFKHRFECACCGQIAIVSFEARLDKKDSDDMECVREHIKLLEDNPHPYRYPISSRVESSESPEERKLCHNRFEARVRAQSLIEKLEETDH
jgi:hypothetical protein